MLARRSRSLLAALAILAPAALTGCSAGHRETRVIVLPDPPRAAVIDVRTGNGSVDISTAPKEHQTTIVASLRARSRDRLERTEVVAGYEDGALRVRVEWPDGRRKSNEGASFDIETPGASDVTVETDNGRIAVAGADGQADLRTSNGAIVVDRHRGAILAETNNGRIQLDGELHEVRAQTSNGGVSISGADGPVVARTSNGAVSIALTDDNPGPVEARSSNGAVRLDLGPAFRGRLTLDTSNGRVTVEDAPLARIHAISRSHAELTLGDGDDASLARTSNGSVTARFRAPAR